MVSHVYILILAVTSVAYSGDPHQDFLNVEEGNALPRVRRYSDKDEEIRQEYNKHFHYCCNNAVVRQRTEEEKNISLRIEGICDNRTITAVHTEGLKGMDIHICYSQCIYQTWNMTDDQGNILEDQEHLEILKTMSHYQDPMILQNTLSRCPTWAKQTAIKHEDAKCNSEALYLWFCTYDMMNLFCPENLKDKSESCTDQRKMLKNMYSIL